MGLSSTTPQETVLAFLIHWTLGGNPCVLTLASTIDSHTNPLFHMRMLAFFETCDWQVVAVGEVRRIWVALRRLRAFRAQTLTQKLRHQG